MRKINAAECVKNAEPTPVNAKKAPQPSGQGVRLCRIAISNRFGADPLERLTGSNQAGQAVWCRDRDCPSAGFIGCEGFDQGPIFSQTDALPGFAVLLRQMIQHGRVRRASTSVRL